MKKGLLSFIVILLSFCSYAQLLTWTPNFAQESTSPFTITLDGSKGNQGLFFYTPVSDVYVHIGVITNLSPTATPWKYVKYNQNFNVANSLLQTTSLGNSKWSFTINGGIRSYFGITDPGETILKIAILFRNGNGSKVARNTDGSDMYIPIYTNALATRFTEPLVQPTFLPRPETITKVIGNTISMTGIASSSATMRLYLNGTIVQTALNATTISAAPTINVAGNQVIVVEADNGILNKRDTIQFYVAAPINVAALPAGVKDGINYEADNTAATLVLYAPSKNRVSVIGDLTGSNWAEQLPYQMNKTPDGNYWWIRLTGLTPGT